MELAVREIEAWHHNPEAYEAKGKSPSHAYDMPLEFKGEGVDGEDDVKRLAGQLLAVFQYMADERWHTNREIALAVRAPEPSITACYRALRRPEYGGHTVERQRRAGENFYWYRLRINTAHPYFKDYVTGQLSMM